MKGAPGKHCFCHDEDPKEELKVDDSLCDSPCPDNDTETCGGDGKVNVYKFGWNDNADKR